MLNSAQQNASFKVLIVDDTPENLAYLHDALDESGYTVFVASNGEMAIKISESIQPDVILLDAMMPGMDGFATCERLKASDTTVHIPVVFMTGLTEVEHITRAFAVGGVDYVTKPVRPAEVLARMRAHANNANKMQQATTALDAFGQATMAIEPATRFLVWQTPLAKHYLSRYFPDWGGVEVGMQASGTLLPTLIFNWVEECSKLIHQTTLPTLSVTQEAKRLTFTVANATEEQWVIVLREVSDEAQIEALIKWFHLTKREAEVLYWIVKGKTNKDVGEILGTSPRTVNKHLEHVFQKLGVETRTAAASLVAAKIKI